MKKFGDIRDSMPPACPITGYDCGRAECKPADGICGRPESGPNRGGKVWGVTTPAIVTPMFEMHKLDIRPWMQCSIHRHQFKHNAFYVVEGELFIDTLVGLHVETKRMTPGDHHTVSPGIKHRFRTGASPCRALEMYYTEPLSEDIVRDNVGGPVERR